MKIAAILAILLGLGLMAFGWWGQNSAAGKAKYDEMDGILPWIAMILGGMVAVAGITWIIVLITWHPRH